MESSTFALNYLQRPGGAKRNIKCNCNRVASWSIGFYVIEMFEGDEEDKGDDGDIYMIVGSILYSLRLKSLTTVVTWNQSQVRLLDLSLKFSMWIFQLNLNDWYDALYVMCFDWIQFTDLTKFKSKFGSENFTRNKLPATTINVC